MHIDIDTHKELVEMAEYGDSLSNVVQRLIDFYKKNIPSDNKLYKLVLFSGAE
jgi:predicted CopG family antitoxin